MPTVWPSNSSLRYVPKRNKSTCPYQDLYKNVYSSSIFNSWKLETSQVSIFVNVKPLRYIHTMEYYTEIKRNKKIETKTTWMNFKIIIVCKEARQKECTQYVHQSCKILENANYSDRKQISDCLWRGLVGRTDYKTAQGNFWEWWKCPSSWL